MDRHVEYISQRLSLRKAQKISLDIMAEIYNLLEPNTRPDVNSAMGKLLDLKKFEKLSDFERNFPSFTYALATGVGKTRLMGAFISWLYTAKGMTDFMIIAPNLPIYNKLIEDFSNPACPKYVFQGLAEFVHVQPVVITGENYARVNTQRHVRQTKGQRSLFGDNIFINIFNISKINADTRGGKLPRIKRLREELGESYFEYLKNLKDLVILMDESHHYRADRGLDVINELDPILGLEFTATPFFNQKSSTVPFKNVVYEYPLATAVNDGLVKVPAIATRKNVDSAKFKEMSDEELDSMKMKDAIYVHRETKIELELYARNNNVPVVKPFILIVCQDIEHAGDVENILKSPDFFDGYYADKVITVHSQLKGDEKEDNIQALLSVEDPRNKIEIVIHVNMLKEGWDVTNLYTLVPLRKFGAQILTEQTLGRGLRLPYGERTGNEAVDRLTVMAHENFEKLIEDSKKPGSIVLKEHYIDTEESQTAEEVVTVHDKFDQELTAEEKEAEEVEDEKQRQVAIMKVKMKQAFKVSVNAGEVSIGSLKSLADGVKTETSAIILTHAEKHDFSKEEIAEIEALAKQEVAKTIIKNTIQIPRITIQPSEEVAAGFKDFKLDTSLIPKFQPVSEDIYVKTLEKNSQNYTIGQVVTQSASQDTPENILVSRLLDYEDVDYERDGDLLFKLAEGYLAYLKSYEPDEANVENIVRSYVGKVSELIHEQMEKNFFFEQGKFEDPKVKPFSRIEPHNYSSDRPPRNYTDTVSAAELRKTLFCGFKKSCHELYKFDSKPEKNFSEILESDKSVEKWLRPSIKQFNIYWQHNSRRYEPDFVVELTDKILLVEVKRASEMTSDDVLEKARAASEYCRLASNYAENSGGKPWKYLLIPEDAISPAKDVNSFLAYEKAN